MCMTTEAYDEKKWRGLKNLQSAMSRTKLDDHHFGWSSASYNKFEAVSDVLQISLLVLENIEKIPTDGSAETATELKRLSDEVQDWAMQFSNLSSDLRDEAARLARTVS